MEQRDQIFIITGGAGFGKSTLVSYLNNLGYKTGEEAAREIIREQRIAGGVILPEKDIRSFQNLILQRRINFFLSVNEKEIAFADRAIPDQIAFARFNGVDVPDTLAYSANEYRYNKTVFVTPPWKEIYRNDLVRTESFEKSCELHRYITDVYTELGYVLIEIPKFSVKERAKFILNLIRGK